MDMGSQHHNIICAINFTGFQYSRSAPLILMAALRGLIVLTV